MAAANSSNELESKGLVKRKQEESPTAEENSQKRASNSVFKNHTHDNVTEKVKCKLCLQNETDQVIIPPDAQPECVVLANDVLANIFTDEFNDVVQHNLTNYSIYDENGHLCSIDSGIMERNVNLYLTGYVKPIFDHDPSIVNGFAAQELGPILEWWLSSYDGGSKVMVGVSTDFADYLLIEPHLNYKTYMTSVTEKIHLSRLFIESMLLSPDDDPIYEDILVCIKNSVNPATNNKFTEDRLILHAQFVIDQVIDYDANDTHYLPLAETQCVETLIQFSGATKPTKPPRNLNGAQRDRGVKTTVSKREYSKACTTELVKDIFENMFADQLEINDGENSSSINKLVKAELDDVCMEKLNINPSSLSNIKTNEVIWNDQKLCKQMFVIFKKKKSSSSELIGRIEYLFKLKSINCAHIILFMHSYHTVLGEASDCQEIFALKKCTAIDINNIVRIVDVNHKVPSDDWFNLGNSKLHNLLEPVDRNNKNEYFFQLQYDDEFGRFEYPKLEDSSEGEEDNYCSVCEDIDLKELSKIPEALELIQKDGAAKFYFKFKFDNELYKVGNFIYLRPGTFLTSNRTHLAGKERVVHSESNKNKTNQELKQVDETKYPEYYRKTMENSMRGSNETTPDPFDIGEILAIYTYGITKDFRLIVRRMYRAEQIPLNGYDKNSDMNLLFWSDEEFQVFYPNIRGKCFVAHLTNIHNPLTWCAGGPDRFYFIKKYDFITGSIIPDYKLPSAVKLIGREVYVGYDYKFVEENYAQYIPSYAKIKPLRGLDIFAGCGGLSRGLEDSGLAKSKWAIECDDKAADAFRLNNPDAIVYIDDCNNLLKIAMSGSSTNAEDQSIPKKGDIEFICGGPPCQGFSGMNRFNSGQYSLFKNSLIVTFLSYIDYYRPKYFVMENVRNFVSFKKNMVLRLTLRCITRMGYQCTFGVLQAGNFGVPQTRRRIVIMGAAPGEQLPLYPEPLHVFNKRASSLSVQIGDNKFRTNCKYEDSAPMRTVTVYDAWSDLPKIPNGANAENIPYLSKPITHLQRLLRYPENSYSEAILTDHICKDMSPLVQARMALIPVAEGSDWRDLPNIEVKLTDGTMTNKLIYTHHDLKNEKGPNGALHGVCACASGEKCNPQDRQNNTIIPWCLPHTANRHNNWAGLYGRLAWTGFCSTTITNPEPMGKQGRVLHPEQHRVVSVRECARSQGFKDSFVFCGPIINKHRQIGNAVPPPLGKAIGHEIIKAITNKCEHPVSFNVPN